MKITLLTDHVYNSKRRAGFHFIADKLQEDGHTVYFITTNVSLISYIKRDRRIGLKNTRPHGNIINIFWESLTHPASYGKLAIPFTECLYKLQRIPKSIRKMLSNSDIIIMESGYALFKFEDIKKVSPNARIIYRVSDDTYNLKLTKSLQSHEKNIVERFDKVSVPTMSIYEKFAPLHNLHLEHHGVDKHSLDILQDSPFRDKEISAVFVGISRFDHKFLEISSRIYPNINFYIIGPIEKTIVRDNIIYTGEIDFLETIKYIRNCSMCLHTLKDERGVKVFSDSLKILQYTYFERPVVAPEEMSISRSNVYSYALTDDSVRECIHLALSSKNIKFDKPLDWKEVAISLINLHGK